MSARLTKIGFLKPFVFILVICMVLNLFGYGQVDVADEELNPSVIELYFLEDKYKEYIGSIPAEYKTSYQINTTGLSGTPKYLPISGYYYASVSSDGLITPNSTYNYAGTSIIRVTCGDYSKDITVIVKDYAVLYADKKIDEVISQNVTDDMTELEKLRALTAWLANNTDYSYYTDYYSMMIFMSGSCVGSSNTIIEMCKRVGIRAKQRPANHDPGAGGGHVNVVALCDGKCYLVDAGYSGTKPRHYDFFNLPLGYTVSGGTIFQYDGFDTDVVIPETLNGKTITKIGTGSYSVFTTSDIKSVKIPKTVQTVDDYAFSSSSEIKVTVDSDNQYLTMSGGALYTKDKTKLIFAPSNISSLTIDKNTTEIAAGAMCNMQLDKVVIPGNVKTVGDKALFRAKCRQIEVESGVNNIGIEAFYGCTELTTLSIPSTVTSIGEGAFNTCLNLRNIYFDGTEEQWNKISMGSELPEKITVHFNSVRVTGIDPNGESNITLTKKGQSLTLAAKVIPSNATNQEITYKSSNSSIARIDGNNLIAVSEGTCTVTAESSDGNYTQTYNVTVKYTRYKLTIDGGYTNKKVLKNGTYEYVECTECEFLEGETFTVYKRAPSNNVRFQKWLIDEDITITNGGVNYSYITVTLPGRDITIKAQYSPVLVTSISLSYIGDYYSYICPDAVLRFVADVYPNNAFDKSVVWSTSDPSVATVDNEGNVTTVGAGSCKVIATAKDGSGISGYMNITVKAHNIVSVAAKSPTKTEPGNIAHYICNKCGKLFGDAAGKTPLTEADVIIPAMGHNLTKVASKDATCTEAGNIEYYLCEDPDCGCGKCYSDAYGQNEISKASTVIPATGHKLTCVTGKAATCETDGVEDCYKCSVCKKIFSDKDGKNEISKPVVIPALGHDPEFVPAKEATMEEVGWKEHYVCKRCGKKFSDSECKNPITDDDILIACKKHVLTEKKAKTPSCIEEGYKAHYKCEDPNCGCGKCYSDKFGQHEISFSSLIIPKTDHALTAVAAKAAICTEKGNIKHWKCTVCGKLFSDDQGKNGIGADEVIIDALGHDLDHLEHHEAKAATRDNDGSIEYWVCPRCGKKFADSSCKNELNDVDIIIPAIGAAKLGEEAPVNGLEYKVTNSATDGSGKVTLIGISEPIESVSIPLTVVIKETTYIVNRIGTGAFQGNTSIKSVRIGSNVVIIDNNAFYGCTNLVSVSGGAGLKTIGSNAFARCPKLASFVITSKVLYKISPNCFYKDSKLKTLYIKNTTKLKKSGVKKSLKGSSVKTVKVKKSKVKKYKKYFTKKNCGRKVKVKK